MERDFQGMKRQCQEVGDVITIPALMRRLLEEKAEELRENFQSNISGPEEEKQTLVTEMDQQLQKEMKTCGNAYQSEFTALIERIMEKLRDFQNYYRNERQCLEVGHHISIPALMRRLLEEKAEELRENFQSNISGPEEEKQTLVTEMDQQLQKEMKTCGNAYQSDFTALIGRIMEEKLSDFQKHFGNERQCQEVGDVITIPALMRRLLEEKAEELRENFQSNISGPEEEKQTLVTEMDQQLQKEMKTCGNAYQSEFTALIERIMEKLRDFQNYYRNERQCLEVGHHISIPALMRRLLEEKAEELRENFQSNISGPEEEKQTLVTEMDQQLQKEMKTCGNAYQSDFTALIGRIMEEKLSDFQKHFGNERQCQEVGDVITIPALMRRLLEEKAEELRENFQSNISGPEEEKQTLVTEMDQQLQKEMKTCGNAYQSEFTALIERIMEEKLSDFQKHFGNEVSRLDSALVCEVHSKLNEEILAAEVQCAER
ncbi:coiled-coil domain-containing protein 91-like [Scyliorhinus canicula]|uniref:coiled-coil domain-containing protein 91-like n=1 Tax=Scyliorhinus canicula TaxID=7830 RepID=UPI0018F2DDDF|nr:coiled-coil domain-containing protein 91-like [Scyliorhinus canicula]